MKHITFTVPMSIIPEWMKEEAKCNAEDFETSYEEELKDLILEAVESACPIHSITLTE